METAEHRALWDQHQQANYASVVAAAGPTMTTTARTRLLRRRVLMVETYVGATPDHPGDHRECFNCRIWKPTSEFHHDAATPTGVKGTCGSCARAYARGFYASGRLA